MHHHWYAWIHQGLQFFHHHQTLLPRLTQQRVIIFFQLASLGTFSECSMMVLIASLFFAATVISCIVKDLQNKPPANYSQYTFAGSQETHQFWILYYSTIFYDLVHILSWAFSRYSSLVTVNSHMITYLVASEKMKYC